MVGITAMISLDCKEQCRYGGIVVVLCGGTVQMWWYCGDAVVWQSVDVVVLLVGT